MKKILLIVCGVILLHAAQAQDPRLGVRGGFNFANQNIENELLDLINSEFDTKLRFGWQVGVVLEQKLNDQLFVQPSLLLSSQGYSFKEDNAVLDVKIKARPLYLLIPAPVVYRANAGMVDVFAGAGPYLGFGIGGKVESEGDLVGFDFVDEGKIEWGGDDQNTYRAFDWGLALTAGAELNSLQFALSYHLGIANIDPRGNEDNSIRNRMLSLSTTFFLPQ